MTDRNKITSLQSVSYTHLDVYKRQATAATTNTATTTTTIIATAAAKYHFSTDIWFFTCVSY